jgi:hypothetical protein
LEVKGDYRSIAEKISRDLFDSRCGRLEKHRELLSIENRENIVSLARVRAPLMRCENLDKTSGLRRL